MCLAVQADPKMAALRRCQRTHAGVVVQRLLPRGLLAVGDVLNMFKGALTLIAKTLHRITPGRSTPRAAIRIKPHARFSYKG